MKNNFIPFEEIKRKALKNPKVKEAHEKLNQKYAVMDMFIGIRAAANLTQEELAERMGVSQPTIGRIESGGTIPSLKTFFRYAEAAGVVPIITYKTLPKKAHTKEISN